jgi:polyhydroxybutyrate depolymerase
VAGSGRRSRVPVAIATALALAALGCSGDGADEGTGGAGEAARGIAAEDVAPDPSAGCGAAEPPVTATPAGSADETVTLPPGGGRDEAVADGAADVAAEGERWYLRHVPPAHDGTTPVPLVVDLHSYAEGAEVHTVHSGLGPHGDEAGFVTVTPQGTGVVPMWRATPGSPDVAFVGQVLDHVEATLCVDRARVYVAGLSNGAMLASVLACELPDRIAAVAAVAGVTAVEGCDPDRPVPVVAFHGTEDPFLDYDGGFGAAVAALPAPDGDGVVGDAQPAVVMPVPEVVAAWAGRNGCDAAAGPSEEGVAEDVTRLAFDCPAGAEVVLYRVEGGGSTWPGAELLREATDVVGVTTFSVAATEITWSFFTAHARADAPGR